jgi:carboxyl-terminal processing protease
MAEASVNPSTSEFLMTARTRLWVLAISTPIIVFVLVGGYLGQAFAKDDTYQNLRVFDDVVSHVVNNYVEEVDLKQAMRGAMRGMAEALDADSAFLTP